MGRPREFDIDKAIERATDVFWDHGYEGASLPDLLNGMELTRGSLYKAFTDKRSLFLRVLELYERRTVQSAYDMLIDTTLPDGRKRIQSLFISVYQAVKAGDHRGCLLCSTAARPSAYDPEISKHTAAGLNLLRTGIVRALKDSPKHCDWDEGKRLRLADHLLTQYVGLRIIARSQVPMGILEHAGEGIAELLD
ncbi:MAG: TetR/AcrR family transcriptional regulator [Paracoccaceae bacterium]